MSFTFRMQLFAAVLFFSVLSQVTGHSYMTTPVSRSNQAQSNVGCRGPSCLGPCDIPLSKATRAPIVAARGNTIQVDWPRNNHAGGFIRFAWAPTDQSDSHAAFDAHVQQINCHEVGCGPADINDPNGGGSGPADGSSGACTTTINVPLDLTDGKWTLQWAWFGGGFALGDYYSCADYVIAGGPSGQLVPVFKGGDFSYPGQQKCKFFNTDKLHVCINEPCNAPIYASMQAQSGAPADGQLGSAVSHVVAPVTPVVQTPVSTPAVSTPSTTGRVLPSTTASASPSSPASPIPSSPISNPIVGSNCAGVSTVSASHASFSTVDIWGSQFHALIDLHVEEPLLSDWVLEVTWPASSHSTQVASFFNAGTLQCQGALAAYFKPAASWANNLSAGSKVQVEFIANNPSGMQLDYILANTKLRLLKH